MDITPEARELMGERRKITDTVFEDFGTSATTNNITQKWCLRAGIGKATTFHCGRHTFATMMLTIGTNLFTVSKLLRHSDISTAQIYAKVIDKAK